MTPRAPGQRAGLSRPAVIAAANDLLAERGLDALTMRAVATRLGVAPNAIYSHVANKTALLDHVLDDRLALVREPDAHSDPADGLRAVMTSSREVLRGRPDLVPLYLARQGSRGPQAQRLGEIALTLLGRAGVTGDDAREALRVLIVYTIGFAALGTGPDAGPLTDAQVGRSFDRGLRWLLAGIIPG